LPRWRLTSHASNARPQSLAFSAFGPEPIKARVNIARAKVLVTTETLYRK